jgi:hypothetical protein
MHVANQRGQMTIEMILILVLLLSVALSISKASQSSGWMASLVSGPWKPLQGMIEDGVWVNAGASKSMHPTMLSRHGSYEGVEAPQ